MVDKAAFHTYAKEQVDSKVLDKELVWRLLGYLRPYRVVLSAAILFLIISKAIEASIPIFIGHVSQKILDAIPEDAIHKSELLNGILAACFIIFSLLLISYLFDSANVVLKSWVGQKALYKLRLQVYEHILHMPLVYYDSHSVGRLMTRTIHDVDQINQMFAESVIPILGNLFLFVSIYIGILFINWKIALMVTFVLPFVWWLTHRFRTYQRRAYERIRTVVAAMNTFVQENLMGAATIRNFGLQAQSRERFEEINEDHCNAYVDSVKHFSFFMAGIDLIQNFCLIMAFALIVIWSPLGETFDAGTYFTFSLYALMFFRPLADLAERYNVLQSAMAAATRIFDVLDQHSEIADDNGTEDIAAIESISFENVWFAYEVDNWILKGVNFDIKKGDSVAIVGMTGEGKTTIISLLLRFYLPQKGSIKINGKDIKQYSLSALRKQFSVVLQDPVIFSGTIAGNISLFNSSMQFNQIDQVIDYLNIRSFINKLPQGANHYLTERGKSLSMGQMQLISMARAVAHQRSMFIFDEATANIDTATERLIQEALQKILHGKTALVIAHRLSTIKDVSYILVMREGKIVERGSHKQLLDAKGIYEKLYRLQFVAAK